MRIPLPNYVGVTLRNEQHELTSVILDPSKHRFVMYRHMVAMVPADPFVTYQESDVEWLYALGKAEIYVSLMKVDPSPYSVFHPPCRCKVDAGLFENKTEAKVDLGFRVRHTLGASFLYGTKKT